MHTGESGQEVVSTPTNASHLLVKGLLTPKTKITIQTALHGSQNFMLLDDSKQPVPQRFQVPNHLMMSPVHLAKIKIKGKVLQHYLHQVLRKQTKECNRGLVLHPGTGIRHSFSKHLILPCKSSGDNTGC